MREISDGTGDGTGHRFRGGAGREGGGREAAIHRVNLAPTWSTVARFEMNPSFFCCVCPQFRKGYCQPFTLQKLTTGYKPITSSLQAAGLVTPRKACYKGSHGIKISHGVNCVRRRSRRLQFVFSVFGAAGRMCICASCVGPLCVCPVAVRRYSVELCLCRH
jgi:hypothetical protein